MSLNRAKVFTITSVKGGVGKSTTTLNLAGMYSKIDKKVLIIDLDLSNGDIAPILNIPYDYDIYNLYEDLNNNNYSSFEDYIIKYNDNIEVLAAPKDPRYGRKISNKTLKLILYKASLKYDIVLIDTNHILTDINLLAYDYSDQILFIINNDSMNLKSMKSFVSILNYMDKSNYKIILNEAINPSKNFYNNYDIKNIIGKSVSYVIPKGFYINNIDKYIVDGKILTLDDKVCRQHKASIKIFELISNDLLKESRDKYE